MMNLILSALMSILSSAVVSILSFGATPGDDSVNNAAAINAAIDECAWKGGGEVVVPKGTFTTGSVYLKSNVHLRLEKGATLRGSARISDYSPLVTSRDLSRYESGQGTVNYNSATDPQWSLAMIFAIDVSNSGITGKGCIDGADVRNPLGEEHMRGPHTILMSGCQKMTFSDFSVRHSANYAFLGYAMQDSRFEHLLVEGGWDGIHIRGAKDVSILNSTFHTGDDAIAGGYWEGMLIKGCTLNSSCNGIRMIMPSDGLEVADCHIYGPGSFEHITSHRTNSEAAINLEPGAWGKAPGRIDNVLIRRNRIEGVLTPLSLTLGNDNSAGLITFEDNTARGITRMALSVKSWGSAKTDRVVMRRCDLEFVGIDDPGLPEWFKTHKTSEWPVFPCWGMFFRNVGQVDVKKVTLRTKGKDYRPAYMTQNVEKDNLEQGCSIISTCKSR